MAQKWQIGDKIKGKYDEYQVYKILGGREGYGGVHSGMGIVYICYALEQKLPVALKTFQERLFASKEAQEMFRREALIWTELERYPYIVRAYWIEEIGGQLFIVLEYVAPDKEGRNILTHYLRELSLADSLRFAIQFCYGMEYAYSKSVQVHRDIKKALWINPRYAEAWNNKGAALADLGKPNDAILCYDKVLEINPRYVEAWYNKGDALADLGKPNDAILCFDKALEINLRYAEAWYNKGVALAMLSNFPEALKCAEEVIRLNPNLPQVHQLREMISILQ